MGEQYDIVVTAFSVGSEDASEALQRVFGLSRREANGFVRTLPRVAKAQASAAVAARYAEALRSMGAQVECRKVMIGSLSAARDSLGSLPLPHTEAVPLAMDSWGAQFAEQAGDVAVAHYRAIAHLQPEYSVPPIDLLNPKFPKAPPLPHDLSLMPNAKLPVWSDPPRHSLSGPYSTEPTDPSPAPFSLPSSGAVFAGLVYENAAVSLPAQAAVSSEPPEQRQASHTRPQRAIAHSPLHGWSVPTAILTAAAVIVLVAAWLVS